MHMARTVNELVEALTGWLSGIWPDLTGYAHALPEPSVDSTVSRGPLFVVTAGAGTFGVNEATAVIVIGIQVASDASSPLKTYAFACKWLRDKIDAFGNAVYNPPDGLLFGCRPRSPFSWVLPTAQPRPVWQAQVTITFDLPSTARANGDFLI